MTQRLREVKENRGDLVVLWLDLANANGSLPHKLVEEALRRHNVPAVICNLRNNYYQNFKMRISSNSSWSEWHELEKGIIKGCTISVVFFSLAMNMIVKAAEVECRGPLSKSRIRQPL